MKNLMSKGQCLLLFLALIVIGCSQRKAKATLEVRELLSNSISYEGKIVTLHGCYQNGVERVLIGECNMPGLEEFVGVIPYTQVESTEASVPGYRARSTSTEHPSAQEEARYRVLRDLPNGKIKPTTVRGEVRCDSRTNGPFGTKCHLILYRVLSID